MQRQLARLVASALFLVMGVTGCSDDADVIADASTTSSTVPISTTTASPTTTAVTTSTTTRATDGEPGLVGAGSPIDAVYDYLEALAMEDYAGAWALLHPRSRDAFPNGWEGYDGETGLVEGAGAYAVIDKGRYQSAEFDQTVDDESAAAVSLWGEVEQEGDAFFAVLAFGARTIDGLWYVESNPMSGIVFESPPTEGATIQPADGVVATYSPGHAVLETVAVIAGTERSVTVAEDDNDPESARFEVDSIDTGSQQVVIGVLLTTGDLVIGATYFSV